MPRSAELAKQFLRFIRRHQWSLPLALVSAACFVLLASEVREGELVAFDKAIMELVASSRGRSDRLMLGLTRFGDVPVMAALAALIAVLLLFARRVREAQFMLFGALGALLMNTALKLLFQRARPENTLGYLVQPPSSFSFPSGHAMGSMGVLGTIVVLAYVLELKHIYRVAIVSLAAPLIVGIGLSRVYFGVHYPSDVLGGQLAGAAWVSAVTGWFYPRLLPGEQAASKYPSELGQ